MFASRAEWRRRMSETLSDDQYKAFSAGPGEDVDIPLDERADGQSAFFRWVNGAYGAGSLSRGEAMALGGHRDTRDFSKVMGHPVWDVVKRQSKELRGCVLYPFSLSDSEQHLHDGLDDVPLLKAAIEQFRRDSLVEGFAAWRSGNSHVGCGECACEALPPGEWKFGAKEPPVCHDEFDEALRWFHCVHPSRCMMNDRLDVSAWKAMLIRDCDPLWAAAVYYQISHGAVLCPVPASTESAGPSHAQRADDVHASVFEEALISGVEKGNYLLWDRAQQVYPELAGMWPLFINDRFVIDQGDPNQGKVKFREITNMRPKSNLYCISRGTRYPRVRDHIRRLIPGCGGPRREQYKLDVAAGNS